MLRVAGCAALVITGGWGLGCDEKPEEQEISQFERPQDVALVCYHETDDGLKETLPLPCCKPAGGNIAGYCGGPLLGVTILGFVTQTTTGEVALVDLYEGRVVDQDVRIPFNSFIPVGGQPNDIAATWDGSRVYTANFETGDLSAISVLDSLGPTISPASSIDLGGPAAKIVLSHSASIRDQYAFVTQPTLGRLTVVALDPAQCPGGQPQEQAVGNDALGGCVLGYMRLDAGTGLDHVIEDTSPEGIHPWSIIASDFSPSIFVAGMSGEYIVELDSEVLVEHALALAAPGELGEVALVRRLAIDGYSVRSMAIEPELERWIYAIENETGGILVLDLITEEIVQVNADNPLIDSEVIEVPGKARSIAMIRPQEVSGSDPVFTFNGSFAVVSTTASNLYVIDVDDLNATVTYPHTLRSANPLDPNAPNQMLEGEPLLTMDDQNIAYNERYDYAFLADAGLEDVGCDAGAEFRQKSSYGVHFKCDPRQSNDEIWALFWQGRIGLSGAAVLDESVEAAPGTVAVLDETKDLCRRGLLGPGIYPEIKDSIEYEGDLWVITSEPLPDPLLDGGVADCTEYENKELIYQVKQVIDKNTLLIGNVVPNEFLDVSNIPLPRRECFGQAFSYDIRAYDHWVLEGQKTGRLHHGAFDGQCIPVDPDPEQEERLKWRRSRVFRNAPFFNYYFSFMLKEGELLTESDAGVVDTDVEQEAIPRVSLTFTTAKGFKPLYTTVAANVTDIEVTPELDLILIDQSGQKLFVFDFLRNFAVVDQVD